MTTPTDLDLRDVIDNKAKQLRALLQNTFGESGESFRNMNDEMQDVYLWACADMADEIVNALDAITDRRLAALGITPKTTAA